MLRRACVRRFDVELLGCSIPSLASSGCLAVLELLRHTTPNTNTTTFRRCSSTLDSVGQHRAEQRRSRRLDITSHHIALHPHNSTHGIEHNPEHEHEHEHERKHEHSAADASRRPAPRGSTASPTRAE